MDNRNRVLTAILIAAIMGMSAGYAFALASPTYSTVIQPGSMVSTASYIVSSDGANVFVRNGTTGAISYSGTNAAAAIQTAINALPTGGSVFIKAGTYTISATILVSTGITLFGEGPAVWHGISNASRSTKLVLGVPTISILKAFGEDSGTSYMVTVRDIWFDATSYLGSASTAPLVDFHDVRYATLTNNYFHWAPYDCVRLGQSNKFIGNVVATCGRNGIVLATDDWVENNDVSGAPYKVAFTGWAGIFDGTGANMIIGNQVYLSTWGYGITAYGTHLDQITTNTVHHNYLAGIYYFGYNGTISNNLVFDNSFYGSGSYPGISIEGGSKDTIVGGNRVYNRDYTYQGYGIKETGIALYVVYYGNDVRLNLNGGMYLVSPTSIAVNNLGYNPVGVLSTPFDNTLNYIGVLGASGTLASAKVYLCVVTSLSIYWTGGTVTAQTKRGTAIPQDATGPNTVVLYPGDTYSITFSVTPTTFVVTGS